MNKVAGGTEMHCPNCDETTACKAMPYENDDVRLGKQRRLYNLKYKDINWFERKRLCLSCSNEFTTVEIVKDSLNELIKLRDVFKGIKQDCESFTLERLRYQCMG